MLPTVMVRGGPTAQAVTGILAAAGVVASAMADRVHGAMIAVLVVSAAVAVGMCSIVPGVIKKKYLHTP